jgi:DNA-binding transcriptional LysR family regulator
MMELRHLRYFVAVAGTMSVTRAARDLHLAQPALSQQIKALEAELGVALLRRSGRGIELTAAGRRFHEDAKTILAQSQSAVLAAQQVARGDVGRLVVGMTESAGFSPMVTEPIRRFIRAHPGVDLTLIEGRTEDLVKALADRAIDVALVRPPVAAEAGWRISSFHRERLVAAVPSDHPLAARPALHAADLEGLTVVWPRRRGGGGGVSQVLDAALRDSGVVLKGFLDTTEFATAINMAATGIGIALVPESLSGLRPDAVVFAPFEPQTPIFAELVLVTRVDGHAPAAKNFQDYFSVRA